MRQPESGSKPVHTCARRTLVGKMVKRLKKVEEYRRPDGKDGCRAA